MAEQSLRDYFIRFLFKTDKNGAKEAQTQIDGIARKLEKLGQLSFFLNEITGAVGMLAQPFRQLYGFIDATAREADELGDLADRTGIATDKLEGYAFMAKLAGTNSETMITGLRKLEAHMGEAAHGGKEAGEMFARLGVRLRGPNGQLKKVDEMLPDVAAAFQKLPSHAEKTALAMKLFGRAGQDLLPFLERGKDGIAAMQKELEELGGVTSQEFLDASSQYADNMDKLTVVWRGLRQAIAGPIVRAINQAAEGFLTWWKAVGGLMRTRVGEWAFQLVTSFDALWTVVKRFSTAILVLAALFNIPMLAMMGLHLLIGLIIDDFVNWMAGNRSLIGIAIANWDDWLAKVGETHPILAEIMRLFGKLVAFGAEGWRLLADAWTRMTDSILDGTWLDSLKEMVKFAFKSIADFMLAPITDTWDRIKTLIYDALLGMKGVARSLGLDKLADGLGDQAAGVMRGETRVIPNGAGGANGALATAGATAGGAGGANVNAPVSIQINAGPGMDEKQLAQEVGKQFDMRMDSVLRQGFNAVVPEAY